MSGPKSVYMCQGVKRDGHVLANNINALISFPINIVRFATQKRKTVVIWKRVMWSSPEAWTPRNATARVLSQTQLADPWSWSWERCSACSGAAGRTPRPCLLRASAWGRRQWRWPSDWCPLDSAQGLRTASIALHLQTDKNRMKIYIYCQLTSNIWKWQNKKIKNDIYRLERLTY